MNRTGGGAGVSVVMVYLAGTAELYLDGLKCRLGCDWEVQFSNWDIPSQKSSSIAALRNQSLQSSLSSRLWAWRTGRFAITIASCMTSMIMNVVNNYIDWLVLRYLPTYVLPASSSMYIFNVKSVQHGRFIND